MKEKLKRFFTEYSREKIIALFVTFIIWTFAVNRNQETRSFNVKVDVKTSKRTRTGFRHHRFSPRQSFGERF